MFFSDLAFSDQLKCTLLNSKNPDLPEVQSAEILDETGPTKLTFLNASDESKKVVVTYSHGFIDAAEEDAKQSKNLTPYKEWESLSRYFRLISVPDYKKPSNPGYFYWECIVVATNWPRGPLAERLIEVELKHLYLLDARAKFALGLLKSTYTTPEFSKEQSVLETGSLVTTNRLLYNSARLIVRSVPKEFSDELSKLTTEVEKIEDIKSESYKSQKPMDRDRLEAQLEAISLLSEKTLKFLKK